MVLGYLWHASTNDWQQTRCQRHLIDKKPCQRIVGDALFSTGMLSNFFMRLALEKKIAKMSSCLLSNRWNSDASHKQWNESSFSQYTSIACGKTFSMYAVVSMNEVEYVPLKFKTNFLFHLHDVLEVESTVNSLPLEESYYTRKATDMFALRIPLNSSFNSIGQRRINTGEMK